MRSGSDQEYREKLRLFLLLELYKNRLHEFSADRIRTSIHDAFPGEESLIGDVKAELLFLCDSSLVRSRHHPLGATKLHRLTAEGVLFLEREYGNLL